MPIFRKSTDLFALALSFGESPHAARPPVASAPARATANSFLLCIEILLEVIEGWGCPRRACGIATPAEGRHRDAAGTRRSPFGDGRGLRYGVEVRKRWRRVW